MIPSRIAATAVVALLHAPQVMATLVDVHEDLGHQAFVAAFEDFDPNNYRVVYQEELQAALREVRFCV
jgi:hypothetical protein